MKYQQVNGKRHVCKMQTTRVKFANYTCVVGHFNVLSCDS